MPVTLEELSDLDYGKEHRFARRTYGPTADELHKELKRLALKSKQDKVRLAAIQYLCAVDGQAPIAKSQVESSGSILVHHDNDWREKSPAATQKHETCQPSKSGEAHE